MIVRTTLLSSVHLAAISSNALLFLLICVVLAGCPETSDKSSSATAGNATAPPVVPEGEYLGQSTKLKLTEEIHREQGAHGLFFVLKYPEQELVLFDDDYPSSWPPLLVLPKNSYLSNNGSIEDKSDIYPIEWLAAGIIKLAPDVFREFFENSLASSGYTVGETIINDLHYPADAPFQSFSITFDGQDAGFGKIGRVVCLWGDLFEDMLVFHVVTIDVEVK
jgi:hypothetical protein